MAVCREGTSVEMTFPGLPGMTLALSFSLLLIGCVRDVAGGWSGLG